MSLIRASLNSLHAKSALPTFNMSHHDVQMMSKVENVDITSLITEVSASSRDSIAGGFDVSLGHTLMPFAFTQETTINVRL